MIVILELVLFAALFSPLAFVVISALSDALDS